MIPRRRYGRCVTLQGNITIDKMIDYFKCTSTHHKLTKRFSGAAIVSNVVLHGASRSIVKHCQRKSCYFTGCAKHYNPVLFDGKKGELIHLDLENAQFEKQAFWALPVTKMNTQDLLIWSQIVFKIIAHSKQHLFLSSAEVSGTAIYNYQLKEDMGLIRNITQTNVDYFHKQASFSSLIHEISLSKLSVAVKRQVLQWIVLIKTGREPLISNISGINHKNYAKHLRFQNYNLVQRLYNETCFIYGSNVNFTHPWIRFGSIALVILFNHDFYNVIPYLELMYRPFFPQIIYCMPSNNMQEERKFLRFNVTIIYYQSKTRYPGGTNYLCVYHVQKLNLSAKGYLFVADDVLLSLSFIKRLPLSLPATVHNLPLACNMRAPAPACKGWVHFSLSAKKMRSFDQHYRTQPSSLPCECMKRIRNMTGLEEPFVYDFSDIYYIPKRYMFNASNLLKAFYDFEVFLEVAVPNVLACLTSPKLPIQINGYADWSSQRNMFYKWVPKVTSEEMEFVHPAKLSMIHNGKPANAESFCRELIPYFHNGY